MLGGDRLTEHAVRPLSAGGCPTPQAPDIALMATRVSRAGLSEPSLHPPAQLSVRLGSGSPCSMAETTRSIASRTEAWRPTPTRRSSARTARTPAERATRARPCPNCSTPHRRSRGGGASGALRGQRHVVRCPLQPDLRCFDDGDESDVPGVHRVACHPFVPQGQGGVLPGSSIGGITVPCSPIPSSGLASAHGAGGAEALPQSPSHDNREGRRSSPVSAQRPIIHVAAAVVRDRFRGDEWATSGTTPGRPRSGG